MLEKTIGLVLKELRESNRVSQEALALNSGLDRTYISLLERGLRNPTILTLFKIAPTLNKTPAEILLLVQDKLNEDPK